MAIKSLLSQSQEGQCHLLKVGQIEGICFKSSHFEKQRLVLYFGSDRASDSRPARGVLRWPGLTEVFRLQTESSGLQQLESEFRSNTPTAGRGESGAWNHMRVLSLTFSLMYRAPGSAPVSSIKSIGGCGYLLTSLEKTLSGGRSEERPVTFGTPKFIPLTGNWSSGTIPVQPGYLLQTSNSLSVGGSVVGGAGGGKDLHLTPWKTKWKPYVTCQQLPRTGAVTSQGSEREAPLYGKHQAVGLSDGCEQNTGDLKSTSAHTKQASTRTLPPPQALGTILQCQGAVQVMRSRPGAPSLTEERVANGPGNGSR
ncbi:unnamed protein product [Pleuronectes platessa]|uniref:Uncharacterized protein n=1 Tax=Pleuronectes platessa TaxID=8262 RepID=A0A9N7YSJ7_PLEPL|nr:unnamed protein product [Pleuronectes platessa]